MSNQTQAVIFVASFGLSLALLIFGSRFVIETFNLFPPDPHDPYSFKNTLHHAWGKSSKQSGGNFFAKMSQNPTEDLIGDVKEFARPIGFAVLLGLSAFVSYYVFGKSKRKPVLDAAEWKEFPLVKKTAVSHNTAIYRFALPSPDDILGLPIGQHISVQAELNGKNITRSYTPTSSDDDRGHFDLMVKTYEKGNISQYLSTVSVGQKVRIKGPKGQFHYRPGISRHLGMIAGGTGITPMLQIIRAILKNHSDKTQVSLIYANVTFDDILLKEELDHLAEAHPDRFTVYYVLNEPPVDGWDGGVGFVTKDIIKHHMPAPKDDIKVLLCGPPPMMTAMKTYIADLGYETPRAVSKLVDQPVLYLWKGSVWAAVPHLAFEELGYTDEIKQESVSVLDGENLELKYVQISAQATLPALVTPEGELYDSSTTVTNYLIKHAPSGAKIGKPADPELLETLHADNIDPNVFLISARNKEELEAKNGSVPGYHLRARQQVLERVAPIAPPEYKEWYANKLKKNTEIVNVYTSGASDDITAPYFKRSQENWDAVANFVINVLPKYLPEQGFIGGDVPGEADFHVGGYLGRIAGVLGGENKTNGAKVFEAFGTVPASLSQYWDTWIGRKSWNVVYKEGLH
ncbi:NADH-cytochrome b5 reductase [Serendipita sp. 399]|nr:NADH-cytochrome b5 reductase [Serendipita sp. 399]